MKNDLAKVLGDIDHEIITAQGLGVTGARVGIDGWTSQQATKLLISRIVASQIILCLTRRIFS